MSGDAAYYGDLLSRVRALETSVGDIQATPGSSNPNYYGVDPGGVRRQSATSVARLTWVSLPNDPQVGILVTGGYEIEIIGSLSSDAACNVFLGIRPNAATSPDLTLPGVYSGHVIGTLGSAVLIVAKGRYALSAGDIVSPRYLHDNIAGNCNIAVEQGMQIFARRVT